MKQSDKYHGYRQTMTRLASESPSQEKMKSEVMARISAKRHIGIAVASVIVALTAGMATYGLYESEDGNPSAVYTAKTEIERRIQLHDDESRQASNSKDAATILLTSADKGSSSEKMYRAYIRSSRLHEKYGNL